MARPRKDKFIASGKADDLDALTRIVREMSPDKLRAILKRDKQFTFRLSEMDRQTMETASKALDIPVAEYLIRLHWAAYESMRDAGLLDSGNRG